MDKSELLKAIQKHVNFNEFVNRAVIDPNYVRNRLFAGRQNVCFIGLNELLLGELELQLINGGPVKDQCPKGFLDRYFNEYLLRNTSMVDRQNILGWLDSGDFDSFSSFFKDVSCLKTALRLALCGVYLDHFDDLVELFKNRLAKFIYPTVHHDGLFSDYDTFKVEFDRVYPECYDKFLSDCNPHGDVGLTDSIFLLNAYVAPNKDNLEFFDILVLTPYLDFFYSFDE